MDFEHLHADRTDGIAYVRALDEVSRSTSNPHAFAVAFDGVTKPMVIIKPLAAMFANTKSNVKVASFVSVKVQDESL